MLGAHRRLVTKALLPSLESVTRSYSTTRLASHRGLLTVTSNAMLKTTQRSAGTIFIHQHNMRHYTTTGSDDDKAETMTTMTTTTAQDLTSASTSVPTETMTMTAAAVQDNTTTTVLDTLAQTSTADSIIGAAAQIGDFKAMGLCNFTPVGGLEAMLEAVHVTMGLPWWGSIALATVIVRTALLPLIIKLQGNNARLMNINPEVTRIMNNLKTAQADGDAVATGKYSHEISDLFKKNNCHPMKSLGLPLIQMPVMISFFMALRAMADLPVPGMSEGGMSWFTNLTAQDPYYILPAVSAAGMLAVLEAGTEAGAATPQSKGMKTFMRAITVLTVPFTAWMPSGVFVYWITSNMYSIAQILALKNPSVRSAFNIPQLIKPAKELQKESKGFMENFKDQQKLYEKKEKDRVLRERQQAAAIARRASKRRF